VAPNLGAMRRLALLLALAALASLLVTAGAGAESKKPYPRLIVKSGTVQMSEGQLVGTVVITNAGRKRSGREYVELGIGTGAAGGGIELSALVQRLAVKPLDVGDKQRIQFSRSVPLGVSPGTRTVSACVDGGGCRRLGPVTVVAPSESVPAPDPAPDPTPTPQPEPTPPTPAPPASSTAPEGPPTKDGAPSVNTIPSAPIPYVVDEPFEVSSGPVPYWAFVPDTYDPSNLTAAPLLIWLHGCGGESSGDIWTVDPGAEGEPQDWLTIAVGGREGECWTPKEDEAKVMAALADVETHFNIDRGGVILGGYSSGGDLAYRTGFRHSSTFAALLIENSSPFRDTESSAAESLAAATTKPRIIQLAHTGDTTYPIAWVRREVGEVASAGFPIELIERPGAHYDAHTDSDLREYLLSRIDELLAGLDRLT
jgi:pimeloyl-ACP methyl ester carboxylesterase